MLHNELNWTRLKWCNALFQIEGEHIIYINSFGLCVCLSWARAGWARTGHGYGWELGTARARTSWARAGHRRIVFERHGYSLIFTNEDNEKGFSLFM
jgi:hypothetical protein